MKKTIVVLTALILLASAFSVTAQGPIYLPTPVPNYLPTAAPVYLPQPGPLPPVVPPTSVPLPTFAPTPDGQFTACARSYALLYRLEYHDNKLMFSLAAPVSYLRPGECATVRQYNPYWLQIVSGWAQWLYVEAWPMIRQP